MGIMGKMELQKSIYAYTAQGPYSLSRKMSYCKYREISNPRV